MRLLRDTVRKLKYRIKFFGIKKELNYSYILNGNSNQELKKLMDFYGSDKGGKNNQHNYAQYYSDIFNYRRKNIKNFLEIGLGTNNVDTPSNMGSEGKPLASLRAWRDYFINANIFGADIDRRILVDEKRILTTYVDQTNPKTIKEMFSYFSVSKYDVILEDGLHEYHANICCFENCINYLDDNGIYIIEDVYYKDISKFINYFKNKNYNYSIIEIFHKKNISNNNLIIISKNE